MTHNEISKKTKKNKNNNYIDKTKLWNIFDTEVIIFLLEISVVNILHIFNLLLYFLELLTIVMSFSTT